MNNRAPRELIGEHVMRACEILASKMKMFKPTFEVSMAPKNGESFSGMVYRISANSITHQPKDKIKYVNVPHAVLL